MLQAYRKLLTDFGHTYPKTTFYRRWRLMNNKQRQKYSRRMKLLLKLKASCPKNHDSFYQKYHKEIEDIDKIMSKVAEKRKDKWP